MHLRYQENEFKESGGINMRVTNRMLARNVLQNLQGNLSRMQKYQNQLSSGRSVSKPSDDPLSTVRIMRLNT